MYQQAIGTPSAFITKNKQRLKQFGQNVYLKDGSEFEIEIFNPLQTTILAKIKINGAYISGGGLILRPGERVFLERYLDDAKKFRFDIYEVNGSSREVRAAIANNGVVSVEFYKEYVQPVYTYHNTFTSYPIYTPQWGTGGAPTTIPIFTTQNTSVSYSADVSCYHSDAQINRGQSDIKSFSSSFSSAQNKTIETGRVEKGSTSKQKFTYVDKDFEHFVSYTMTWHIMPESNRPYVSSEVKVYCPKCGRKQKPGDNFCPKDGTPYN